jgi:hypothetical protein
MDTETGKLWTYTKTRTDNTEVPGWVFSGLTKLKSDFDITIEDTVQTIKLNSTVEPGLELAIVKRTSNSEDFNTVVGVGTTLSLWDSTTPVAQFLLESPTRLPNTYTVW